MHNNDFHSFFENQGRSSSTRYSNAHPIFSPAALRPIKNPKQTTYKSLGETNFKLEEQTKTVKFKTAGLNQTTRLGVKHRENIVD
jgi:hypothetical protein